MGLLLFFSSVLEVRGLACVGLVGGAVAAGVWVCETFSNHLRLEKDRK